MLSSNGLKLLRERVRQVENAAIRNIKSRPEFRDSLKPIELAVLAALIFF